MNKKLLVVAIVLALVAAGAAGFYFKQNKTMTDEGNQEKPFSVETKDLTQSEEPVLAKGIPTTLPIEVGAEVLQNYEATTSDGRLQSTVVVTTEKTLAQAVQYYKDYFNKEGWFAPNDAVTTTNSVSTAMRKQNDALQITAKNDSQTNKKTVEITVTQLPKQK